MAYTLAPADAASITDVELAFSTERLLPAWEDVPHDFRTGNLYTRLAEAIFYGQDLPTCTIELREGFTPETLNRMVRAHLQSFGAKHQHKISGVGYMIACAAELRPINN